MPLDFSRTQTSEFEGRLLVCLAVVSVFFFLVFCRLFYLQIFRGNEFRAFSTEHTLKEIRQPATRGVLFDRNRIPIAENRPSFDLAVIPQQVRDLEKLKDSLWKTASFDPALLDARWKETRRLPAFFPLVIASDVPYDQVVRIRAAQSLETEDTDSIDLRGVEIISRPLRFYPGGSIASAALGYVGEISDKDLQKFQKRHPGRYVLGDMIGIAGIERFWEKYLKGRDGYEQRVVDASGREIVVPEFQGRLRKEASRHGHNVVLSLDSRLQRFAEERFAGKAGSLVALDTRSGEVLAMVSLPAYDLTQLVSHVEPKFWEELASDPGHLLLNRAIQGAYPPGSTYKVVTAIAALEEKVIRPDEVIRCGGGLQFGKRFFKCWRSGGHGAISVHRAIAESCDTFFYQMGLRLGVDRLARYAKILGFGERTGIDLEGEKTGTIPTTEWKLKLFKQEWQPGESLSIAVGQGYDTVTPLQNAVMVARVASGKEVNPRIVRAVENEEGEVVVDNLKELPAPLPISEETLGIIRAAMRDVTESPSGTAHGSRSEVARIAGKTGTAQVMSEEAKLRVRAGVKTQDHAWFIAYSPAEEPMIAVSVLAEHGGFGASAAAPIAKDVIEKYLELEEPRVR